MDDVDLHFPLAGVDVSGPVGRQPVRKTYQDKYAKTCARGVNVRGFDRQGRFRGGMRQGLEKYLSPRPGNTEYITQSLTTFVISGFAIDGGDVQPSAQGRAVYLVAVSQGNGYTVPAGGTAWLAMTNGSSDTPPLNITGLVRSAANNQLLFFADGVHEVYYDPTDNTLKDWIPTDGLLPEDSAGNKPRIICTWRGRTVLSGLLKDPCLITMSKVSDPFNWNYAPAAPVPADSAWAGTVGPQGLTSDTITALIPYSDDQMIIGMDHSLALFRGDPMAGGQIDLVTDSIGIAWGEAWCMDPSGIVYFFSNRTGIFGFVPGNQPKRISEAIDSILLNIDTGDYGVRMFWDDRGKCLHVFVTLLAEPFQTQHYAWEAEANAWWIDTFSDNNMNPLCGCVFDGNFQDDRLILLGGWDGYVRAISWDAEDDDGEDILSEVWIGPFLTKYNDSVMLHELQPVMGVDSGDVSYAVYVGKTAEQALDSTPVTNGTFVAGRNYTKLVRRAGYAAYVALTASTDWAMENIRAILAPQGKVRRRGKV